MESSENAAHRPFPPPTGSDFPAGLRVLVVDDDPTCLTVISKMLRQCQYIVTTCTRSTKALGILHERKGWFDLVLSDVHMPDMDGFKLLEQIGLGLDLPVIMMSADDNKDVIMRGVIHGACDYLIKPVRMEPLRNIWQHVVRKNRKEFMGLRNSARSVEENDKQRISSQGGERDSPENERDSKSMKRKIGDQEEVKEEQEKAEEREESPQPKKARVVWSTDLHQQFVATVDQLGVDKAVPKKILELMNHDGLTRENVASHLQKYRLYMKKTTETQQHRRPVVPNALDRSSRLNCATEGFYLKASAASGQIPPLTRAAIHPGARRVNGIASGMPSIDQIGLHNFSAQPANSYKKMRSEAYLQSLNSTRMNDLCGSSKSMDFRNNEQPQQMVQPYGCMNIHLGQHSSVTLASPVLPSNSSFPGIPYNGQLNNSLAMHMTQQGQEFPLSQQQSASISRGGYADGTSSHDYTNPFTIQQQMPTTDISSPFSGGIGNNTNTDISSAVSGGIGNNPNTDISSPVSGGIGTNPNTDISSPVSGGIGTNPNTDISSPVSGGIGTNPNTLATNYVNNSSYNTLPRALHIDAQNTSLEEVFGTTNLIGLNDYASDYDMLDSQNQGFDWNLQDFGICQSEQPIGGGINTCTVTEERIPVTTEFGYRTVESVGQNNHTNVAESSVREYPEGAADLLNTIIEQQETLEIATPVYDFDFTDNSFTI